MNSLRLGFGLFLLIAAAATPSGWAQEKTAKRPTLGFERSDDKDRSTQVIDPSRPASGFLPTVRIDQPTPMATKDAKAPALTGVLPLPETQPFRGRLSVRADAGDGVGYKQGFTYLEAMLPIQQSNTSLFFTDLRLVNFFDDDRWEYNAGLGYRWYSDRCDRVFGFNTFYDARKTDYHLYQQLGLGFEALSPTVEFRANAYVVVGPAHRQVGDTGFVNQGVVNNNTVLQRVLTTERALTGFDMEVGCLVNGLERYATRAYIGYYTYSAESISALHGIRGRLESQLSEAVSLHFAVQNDNHFKTTVTGGLAFHFGAPAYRCGTGRASWEDVLRQRVHRDVNIVISQTTATTTSLQPVPAPPAAVMPPPSEPEEPSEGEQ